jgi:hypothetical protein
MATSFRRDVMAFPTRNYVPETTPVGDQPMPSLSVDTLGKG